MIGFWYALARFAWKTHSFALTQVYTAQRKRGGIPPVRHPTKLTVYGTDENERPIMEIVSAFKPSSPLARFTKRALCFVGLHHTREVWSADGPHEQCYRCGDRA